MSDDRPTPTILVVSTTGYVGGHLVPLLASRGYRVRVMGRSLGKPASATGTAFIRLTNWFFSVWPRPLLWLPAGPSMAGPSVSGR